jgi:DNA repair protein RadA
MSKDEEETKKTKDEESEEKAEYKSLKDVPGIGSETITKLKKIGIQTVEALAMSTELELKDSGIGEEKAKALIAAARATISIPFMTAAQFAEKQKPVLRITTGCKSLDQLLAGGVESQTITELYGEFESGKSQICHQLCVNVQLPPEKGGLDAAALYIDTESTFHPQRIKSMAEALGLDVSEVFKKIIIAEAITSDHQIQLLNVADKVIQKNNIKLIVIDSLTAHFRSEYLGREFLAPRQQKLNQHLFRLARLAKVFNLVAVVTNQVMAKPDAFFSDPTAPIGGHILSHTAHNILYLRKTKGPGMRIAKLVASPYLPEGESRYRILEEGIRDIPEEEKK